MLNRWEIGILILAPLVFGGLILAGWYFSPAVRERALELSLAFGPHPVKKYAAATLRDYPTRDAALALVAFINLNNPAAPMSPAEAPHDSLTEEERRVLEAEIETEVERRRERSEAALISLCELSGESFGTLYEKEGTNYSWGSLSLRMWPAVIASVNQWAMGTFGSSLLAWAPPGLSEVEASDIRVVFQGTGGESAASEVSP